jgi:transcriptional regulator with XRE-family HTH domain
MSTAFSGELRRLLAERGMSQRELARRANYDSGFINKLCRGTRTATPAVAGRLDAVLDAGGALVALVNRRQVLAGAAAIAGAPLFGTLDADGRERLTWAQRHPRRVDQAAVDSLAGVLAAQRRADDALGCRATGTAPQRA